VEEILLLSRCVRCGPERDVIKVARRLGIPSAMLVFSWDNPAVLELAAQPKALAALA
jgi:hypothetical protein